MLAGNQKERTTEKRAMLSFKVSGNITSTSIRKREIKPPEIGSNYSEGAKTIYKGDLLITLLLTLLITTKTLILKTLDFTHGFCVSFFNFYKLSALPQSWDIVIIDKNPFNTVVEPMCFIVPFTCLNKPVNLFKI